ncbi:ferritin family protein [Nostoc sp. FACHB-110]|uniref:ferritin family protein n=1 Tax=Nostoc sp. FACHB-110 TaxID=2692834 RepID=UPI0016849871|nr:ferritin family protein [Nostoc sp. FACHB-110]MBD2441187.1 ferritin-like domain-containing protein [Nostoc sp. FACHB-110]
MNLLTYFRYLASSGAVAYYTASQIRDSKTRCNMLTGLYLSETSSIKFLSTLSERANNEGDFWLAEKLKNHAADENKHSKILAHTLRQIDENIDLNNINQYQNDSKENETNLFSAYFIGYSREQLAPHCIDWDIFFASTYIMEFDASKDFARMAKVLPENDSSIGNLKLGLLSIAEDEKNHAAYLYDAMMRKMNITQVETLVEEWRVRKVNAIFQIIKSKTLSK